MDAPDSRSRLLQLAGERGVSLAQLSALIGRNASYLQQFVRKGSPRKLEETDRRTLARFFGVAEAELGAPVGDSSPGVSRGDWADIPRLMLGASAGPGMVAQAEAALGVLRFSRRWLREQGLDPAMLSTISVAGDSMEPTLRDGDEILVDRAARPVRDGLHVVRLDEALLVKRLDTGMPGVVALVSDNPAYRRIELPAAEVHLVGRVVWKGGRL